MSDYHPGQAVLVYLSDIVTGEETWQVGKILGEPNTLGGRPYVYVRVGTQKGMIDAECIAPLYAQDILYHDPPFGN